MKGVNLFTAISSFKQLMNPKRSNAEGMSSLERVNHFQANLFGEKPEIASLRVFDNMPFSGEKLFGKADAFLEDLEVLKAYAVERIDCDGFYDTSRPLVLLCAAKGMGKTTLFKLWEDELANLSNHYTLMPNYTDITGFNGISDFAELSNVWKKKLFTHILLKLTTSKASKAANVLHGLEMSESKMKKNDVCEFLIRILLAYDKEQGTDHSLQIDELTSKKGSTIWIFLDEFDADFTKEVASINKMAALLNAARDLTTEFSNIKIRVSIRPNVWICLRGANALMSNFKELLWPIEWSSEEIKAVLAKRVEYYIKGIKRFEGLNWDIIGLSKVEKEDWLIAQIFDTEKFDLGKGNRPPAVVLTKLCADRPRWVIELCKAASDIKRGRSGVILIKDIHASFRKIGVSRFHDITSEYHTYCPQVNDILNAFYNAKPSYHLVDLIRYIEIEITSKLNVEIVGVARKCTAKQVANFLYELTFVEPKKIISKHQFEFLHYKDFPDLIESSVTNARIEYDLYWVIHPAFRNILNIGIPTNFEFE